MDELHEMTVEIGGYAVDREKEIMKACMVEWSFRETDFFHCPVDDDRKHVLQASALGTLFGGESTDDVAGRLQRAVWRANNSMCHVAVQAVCLDELRLKTLTIEDEEYEFQTA